MISESQRYLWKARVARSRFARIAVLPMRVRTAGRSQTIHLRETSRWLVSSREHGNFTYDLTALNVQQLEWFVSNVARIPVVDVQTYFRELAEDDELRGHLRQARLSDPQWRLSDAEPHYGRRLGWYAIVRALRPFHIVETGTDKGLGSMVLAAAVLRNGVGRVTTIDTRGDSGYLIGGNWAAVVDKVVGDSLDVIPDLAPVDLFLHDSLHTSDHERKEIELVAPMLTDRGAVLSDNAHTTDVLMNWAYQKGRGFDYFQERPFHHWYPGGGIGISLPGTRSQC